MKNQDVHATLWTISLVKMQRLTFLLMQDKLSLFGLCISSPLSAPSLSKPEVAKYKEVTYLLHSNKQ